MYSGRVIYSVRVVYSTCVIYSASVSPRRFFTLINKSIQFFLYNLKIESILYTFINFKAIPLSFLCLKLKFKKVLFETVVFSNVSTAATKQPTAKVKTALYRQ